MDKLQKQYFLRQQMKAIQKELGEGTEIQEEIKAYQDKLRKLKRPRRGQGGAREADQPPGPDAPRVGRDGRRPDLPRLDVLPALEQGHRRQPRPPQGQEDPRRGPLRPGEGQGADPRVPRRPQAVQDDQGAHPVLRRAARRRQDLARQVHRPGPRAGSSSASPSAASTTRPRSAATAGPTSAPCPAASSRASGGPGRTTPSS